MNLMRLQGTLIPMKLREGKKKFSPHVKNKAPPQNYTKKLK